jgi:hypothetical protein
MLWLIFRWDDWRTVLRTFSIVGFQAAVALIVYVRLIVQLPTTSSDAQVLVFTHQPDLTRTPEIIGTVILFALIIWVKTENKRLDHRRLLLALSFTLLPFCVFNQQIITGRSIQPYHYEIFIVNYVVLIALVLAVSLLCPDLRRRRIILAGALCVIWGALEMNVSFMARAELDPANDELVPIFQTLNRQADYDGTWNGLRRRGIAGNVVFSPDTGVSRLLPTWAPQRPLLTIGSASFQSLGDQERKNNLFTHLYFCGATEKDLRDLLTGRSQDGFLVRYALSTLFGPERVMPLLGSFHHQITSTEIEEKISEFANFQSKFSFSEAQKDPITYVIVPAGNRFDFSRLNLWYYQRSVKRVGKYDLYDVSLRDK